LTSSLSGTQASAFTPAQIADLKGSTGTKVVLAYLSIGEAEDYRFYWQLQSGNPGANWTSSPPGWLGPENPDFPGNYKVRYWESEWQRLIIANPGGHPVLGDQPSYLDRILTQGFDGVFLDIIDAFEFFGPPGDGGNGERPSARTARTSSPPIWTNPSGRRSVRHFSPPWII
jgi:cysteinyl-tRNA synthetase